MLFFGLLGSSWIDLNSSIDLSRNQINIQDDKLQISRANQDDSGVFGCFISNGLEPNLWTEFNLTVEGEIYFSS